jgi:probable F420-dependent oxidoreductase
MVPTFSWENLDYKTTAKIKEFAVQAEALGFDALWVAEHFLTAPGLYGAAWLGPMLCLTHMAAVTKEIRIGTNILILPIRNPVITAKEIATIDALSGGRYILGAGVGWDRHEFDVAGVPFSERGGRTDEALAVIKRLLTEPRVSHHGRYYHFDDVTIAPRPAHGPLDVWIGGRSDVALRRTARYGDGWFPSFITPDEFRAGIERLTAYGAERGRTIDPREAGTVLLSYVTDDRARANQLLQLAAAGVKLPPESMAARSAIGTVEQCAERLQAFVDAGCTKFVLFPLAPPEELAGQIETYAKRLIPRVGGSER